MLTSLALAANPADSSSTMGGFYVVSSLIGIYAARRRYKKESFRELAALPIMVGAGLGTLFLGLFYLIALIRSQQYSTPEAFGHWIGWGLGSALWIGGPAALIAHFNRPPSPSQNSGTASSEYSALQQPSAPIPMRIAIEERSWTVTRQPAVSAGARTQTGEYDVTPQESGLIFTSDKGERRFFAIDQGSLPTDAELPALPFDKLVDMHRKARSI